MASSSRYKWLSIREHALLRPDTYVGPVEPCEMHARHLTGDDEVAQTISVNTSPALLKFVDECVMNALDNARHDVTQKKIMCTVRDGVFEVMNDGQRAISTALWEHPEANTRRVPEILFGELLSGENFADKHEHVGGRNGIGCKIVNLFARFFEVEIANATEGVHYTQRWTDNMSVCSPPALRALPKKQTRSFVRVRWLPDYARLSVEQPENDSPFVQLIRARAVEVAACAPRLTVYFNDEKLRIRSLRAYTAALGGEWVGRDEVTGENDGDLLLFEVCVSSVRAGETSCTLSFVNGVRVTHGTLIDMVVRRIAECISEKGAKRGGAPVKPASVREHFNVVCSALINQPSFASQAKDKLDTRVDKFGFVYAPSAAMARALDRSSGVAAIVRSAALQSARAVQKSVTGTLRRADIPKYQRATKIGGKTPCTLYVTEGDSAKNLALAGFTVIGRDYNGVYPLRGKLLNVHGMTPTQALKNTEVKQLITILGLKFNQEYTEEEARKLPYRYLMVFTDQDPDGSHITGLVLNMLHVFFPSLLRLSFVRRFCTPLIKAVFTRNGGAESFFSLADYARAQQERGTPKHFKYYKGLGTSTDVEAKEYFSNLATHQIAIEFTETCGDVLDTFFSKKRADDRKMLLRAADASASVDYSAASVTCSDFCTRDLIHFCAADNVRSIPSAIDGLKPSQRKVLHTLFARGEHASEVKVAQLAAATAERTSYHHGELSLTATIVNLAQDWVGTNNVPLLQALGQFGSRHDPKPAAPRYIFTRLETPTWSLFAAGVDRALLEYLVDDGQRIEPRYFVPIIPMVLVNGAEGIGTGWSTHVLTFAIADVIDATRCALRGAPIPHLRPSCAGFTGTVEEHHAPTNEASYVFTGTYTVVKNTLIITELPPWRSTDSYKNFVQSTLGNMVTDLLDKSTATDVCLHITCTDEIHSCDIVKRFKLSTRVSTNQMVLFDAGGTLRRFDAPAQIVQEHHAVRRELYVARLAHLVREETLRASLASNKMRFIEEVNGGTVTPSALTRDELCTHLRERGYLEHEKFTYLLSLEMQCFTRDMAAKLRDAAVAADARRVALEATTPEEAWMRDLDELEEQLATYAAARESARHAAVVASKQRKRKAT